MEKIKPYYDILCGIEDTDDAFALKSYCANGYIRAFVAICHNNVPFPCVYDVNTGKYITICKDTYGLFDDAFVQMALELEKGVIGFDICDYDALLTISNNDIHAFLGELQLPAGEITGTLNKISSRYTCKK